MSLTDFYTEKAIALLNFGGFRLYKQHQALALNYKQRETYVLLTRSVTDLKMVLG